MTIEPKLLYLVAGGYFLLLFTIAHATQKGWLPAALVKHPATYVLSLGVFAGAWAVYGVVGMAKQSGYGFLTYYAGIAIAFIFAPLLLLPLLRICRTYMLSSLADLLSFRYHSQWAGTLATVFMLLAVCPLLALQIQAVADSVHILTAGGNHQLSAEHRDEMPALAFCAGITLLTINFGAKRLTAHQQDRGLVTAMAFESAVKLVAMLALGWASITLVFGGFDGLEQWLLLNPSQLALLNNAPIQNTSRTYLLVFFSAAVAMPHMFHMIFAENPNIKTMHIASWGMPLFLLLISLPILPILWAGFSLQTPLPADYFSLAIGLELNVPLLSTLTFVGGLSAASGVIIVTTLALASMCLKHLVLPVYRPGADRNIYRWMRWIRCLFIILIVGTGYAFFRFIDSAETLSNLGLTAFIATLQFLPGIFAALYWQRANHKGFISGLMAGGLVWLGALLLPLIGAVDPDNVQHLFFQASDSDHWGAVTIASLAVNTLIFTLVSLLTDSCEKEQSAAQMCSMDDLNRPARRILRVKNPDQMKEQLASSLGQRTARREVDQVLKELAIDSDENRPFALRRLRSRLETNLSAMMGPAVAHQMVDQLLPYEDAGNSDSGEDISLIEGQLEHYKTDFTGLAADLDNLRRYHRQTLRDLPVGVCSIGADGEILMWNHSIEKLTAINIFEVTGSYLKALAEPWGTLLNNFVDRPQTHLYKQRVDIDGSTLWINLHKTRVASLPHQGHSNGQVIVLEDATELHLLEDELLHSERLASIGRLAAGVAHEIGNPITGIACLAQNLRYDTDNPESLNTAREILVQTQRISKIVQTLVNFAHSGTGDASQLEPVRLQPCIDEAIHLLYLNRDAKEMNFDNRCDSSAVARGDAQRLLQVFVNLLSNARDASPEGSRVSIDCEQHSEQLLVHVTDQGSGISSHIQEQIFDPFFTTKEPGEGTGLGLSLVYSIINDMGGSISMQSPTPHGGTRFTIKLGR